MSPRESLYRLVDQLPDDDVPVAIRVLAALQATGDPVLRSLLTAPIDDEPDYDDLDGGLSEARKEARVLPRDKAY
jgi:hypothetical protein